MQTAISNQFQDLSIHLNDLCDSVLARNIAMLKVISAHDFNPDNQEDFSFLWDVWYNLYWPEVTRNRFAAILKDLLDNKLPENVFIPNDSEILILQGVWSTWLSICKQDQAKTEILIEKTVKSR